MFDGQSAANGLVTQFVKTHLIINSGVPHRKSYLFGIASMPYNLMLAMDWLCLHNPPVNWVAKTLSFACTDHIADQTRLGNSPALGSIQSSSCNTPCPNLETFNCSAPKTSLALPLSPSDHLPKSDFPTPPSSVPNICHISASELFGIDNVIAFGAVCHLPVLVSSSTSQKSVSIEDRKSILDKLPPKYHAFANVFTEKDVDVLPPH